MSLDSLEVARAQYLWTLHQHKPALDDQIKDLAKVFGVLMRAETLRRHAQAKTETADGAASNGHAPKGAIDPVSPLTPAPRPPALLTLPVLVATSDRRAGHPEVVGVCPHPREAASGQPLATRPVGTETLRVQRACRLGLVQRALRGMCPWLRR